MSSKCSIRYFFFQSGDEEYSDIDISIPMSEELILSCRENRKLKYNISFSPSSQSTFSHIPKRIPRTRKKAFPTRRCCICYRKGKRKESRFYCEVCNVGLCLSPCFKLFHANMDYC